DPHPADRQADDGDAREIPVQAELPLEDRTFKVAEGCDVLELRIELPPPQALRQHAGAAARVDGETSAQLSCFARLLENAAHHAVALHEGLDEAGRLQDLHTKVASALKQELVEAGTVDVPCVVPRVGEVRPLVGVLGEKEAPRKTIGAPDVGGSSLAKEARLVHRFDQVELFEDLVDLEHERFPDVVA